MAFLLLRKGAFAFVSTIVITMGAGLPGSAPIGTQSAWCDTKGELRDGTWLQLPPPALDYSTLTFVDPVDGRYTHLTGGLTGEVFRKFDITGNEGWSSAAIEGPTPDMDLVLGLLVDAAHQRLLAVGISATRVEGQWQIEPVEVWELPLAAPRTWRQLVVEGDGPNDRWTATVVFDEAGQTIYLVGGAYDYVDSTGNYRIRYLGDTWMLDLDGDRTWRSFPLSGPQPPGAWAETAFFDPTSRRILLLDPRDSLDTNDGRRVLALSTEGDRSWADLGPLPETVVAVRDVVLDRTAGGLIHVGGQRSSLADTLWLWRFDATGSGSWTRSLFPTGTTTPAVDHYYGLRCAVDERTNRLLLLGGWGTSSERNLYETRRSDVWSLGLDGAGDWQRLYASIQPFEPRWFGPVVMDPVRRRAVAVTSSPTVGVFTFDLGTSPSWSASQTSGTRPFSARQGAITVFDAENDRLILYGGGTGAVEYGDLWELSFAFSPPRWRRILMPEGVPAPSGRQWAAASHDPVRQRMVVFGGYAGEDLNDTWELDLRNIDPTWRRIQTLGATPPARHGHSAVYDSRRDGLLVFGGRTGVSSASSFLQDTWFLSFADCDAWIPLSAENAPGGRDQHAAFYDPVEDRMVALWGNSASGSRFDSHALQLGPSPRWVDFLPAGTNPSPSTAATALYDGVVDRVLVFGSERPIGYTVRSLAWARNTTPVPSVDTGGAVRILGVGPNPSKGDVNIAFELPRATAVHTRMYDVRGRLVRDLGRATYQPGPHILCWDGRADSGERLRDGVYFARMVVEGKAFSGKIVLMD